MIQTLKYKFLTDINKFGKICYEHIILPRFKVKSAGAISKKCALPVVDSYIFNWRGQYKKTLEKEARFKQFLERVTVINSDENCELDTWVNIGEQSYFSSQFQTALKYFNGDIFFHVQGDASFQNWDEIVAKAILYFQKYRWGVYAPNVDYTYHVGGRVNIDSIKFEEETLSMVTIPDTTCWFIHKDIIEQFKESGIDVEHSNKFGWGIDWVICALSFRLGRPVIRDYSFCVEHPRSTGYNASEANSGFSKLVASLDPDIKTTFSEMYNNSGELHRYFSKIITRKYLL